MQAEVLVKKWGNSLGVILPKQMVEKEHLEENEKIVIDVRKEANLTKIFGTLKTDITGQEFKDLIRKGWD